MLVMGTLAWSCGTLRRKASVILGLLLHMAQALQLKINMKVMADTSTAYIGTKDAVLSLLSSCLKYSSFPFQLVYFISETSSLH